MKYFAVFALVLACAYADLDLTEWKAEYGAFPTGAAIRYAAPMYYRLAPKGYTIPAEYKTYSIPAEYKTYTIPAEYKTYSIPAEYKTYTIPAGHRATYDPENFNEVFGFYPESKK